MKKLLVCAWLSTASIAWAEPIVVRSGDHDGFTRLVMQLPPDVEWRAESDVGRQSIIFSGHSDGFDTSQTFSIISDTYLSDILSSASRIDLELTCDCAVKTFLEQGEYLVVDIQDGPPLPPQALTEKPIVLQDAPRSRFNYGDLLWSPPVATPQQTESDDQAKTDIEIADTADDQAISEQQAALVEETRDRLLRGISDAASRGILQAATPSIGEVADINVPAQLADVFDSSTEATEALMPNSGNIRVTNSRDTPNSADPIDLMTSGALCADPSEFDVMEWGTEEPFVHQIAKKRAALYDELGRLEPREAKDLAQLYLFFGFGVEAKQILRLSDVLMQENPGLMDLADIMEYEHARNPRFVHRYSDCDSDLALWGILAANQLPEEQQVNEKAALRALAALPMHLREFLAPIVSDRLIESGNLEAATMALRTIELGGYEPRGSTGLARAKIENERGNSSAADELLDEVIQGNTRETPGALIELVENALEDDTDISADIALLIESFAFENRDGELGRELARAHIIASAKSKQFVKAFTAIDKSDLQGDPDRLSELYSRVFYELVKSADEIQFLELFFSEFPAEAQSLEPETLLATAARLRNLGFADNAETTLKATPRTYRGDAFKILLSQIQMDLMRPDEAITTLNGVEGETADKTRAAALLALGQNQAASLLFQSANLPQMAAQSAWLSDDWVELTRRFAPQLQDVSSLASSEVSQIPTEAGMLSRSESALEQSAAARGVLTNLLQSLPVSLAEQ
ncbi:hypothetical protein KX928_04205 [Roseobacter sp. YSTF-M11]|uniref:Secreted protein n=1 Tax=Roseobacter insulae TaxID=2859783 RepID=A0A9X1FSJ0_9RHOB|nr:hypothetical protein [Roseobacter insulae]MBW4706986.1 hypothetical protein [Roseobacter insulae]